MASNSDPPPDRRTSGVEGGRLVLGVVLATLVLTGPLGVLDVTRAPPALGDGNATVEISSDQPARLSTAEGRFGTDVRYLQLPDATVVVRDLEGSPRLVYEITVPELEVDRTARHVITDEGRLRLRLADRALAPSVSSGTYTGHVALRLQSLSTQTTLVDRELEVVVR